MYIFFFCIFLRIRKEIVFSTDCSAVLFNLTKYSKALFKTVKFVNSLFVHLKPVYTVFRLILLFYILFVTIDERSRVQNVYKFYYLNKALLFLIKMCLV